MAATVPIVGPVVSCVLEQKAIIDRIKITAYNAEEWLLDSLVRYYAEPHDIRDSVFPGTDLRVTYTVAVHRSELAA